MTSLDDLLRSVKDPDKPFPLLKDGPAVCEELLDFRPDKSCLHRWVAKGVGSVKLEVLQAGRARFSTRRMLLQFWLAAGAARSNAPAVSKRGGAPKRRRRVARTTPKEEATLARHGLARRKAPGEGKV